MKKMASAGNRHEKTEEAINDAIIELEDKLGTSPSLVMIQFNAALQGDIVRERLMAKWPDCQLHAATSCHGTLSDKGVLSAPNSGLALLGFEAPIGFCGTGFSPAQSNMAQAAQTALANALKNAKRQGELPDLVWISPTPGHEEDVLYALQENLTPDTPIIGGSAADNEIAGNWSLFTHEGMTNEGCVVTVFFDNTVIGSSFQSAYLPTPTSATVSQANNRTILTLDDQPAAEVFSRWANLTDDQPRNILSETSLTPIGRAIGNIAGTDMYLLSHPESFTQEGHMTLFTDINVGEEIVLMQGTNEMLINRASRVFDFAQQIADMGPSDILGGILVYCAGCMLTIEDDLDKLHLSIKDVMGDKPFITAFTFGEQGQVMPGRNCHGNLMVSAVVWSQ